MQPNTKPIEGTPDTDPKCPIGHLSRPRKDAYSFAPLERGLRRPVKTSRGRLTEIDHSLGFSLQTGTRSGKTTPRDTHG